MASGSLNSTSMNQGGSEDEPRVFETDDTWYQVRAVEVDLPSFGSEHLALFQQSVQVIIFTYDVASKTSFRNLNQVFNQVPAPLNYKIRMPGDGTNLDEMLVGVNFFPKVLIGCKYPVNKRREVEDEDVQRYIRHHRGCVFGGECEPDGETNQDVDEVFRAAVGVYHALRKRAIAENGAKIVSSADQSAKELGKKKKFGSCKPM
jgi:hypothetical protein